MGPPPTHETGHFYFALTHIATARTIQFDESGRPYVSQQVECDRTRIGGVAGGVRWFWGAGKIGQSGGGGPVPGKVRGVPRQWSSARTEPRCADDDGAGKYPLRVDERRYEIARGAIDAGAGRRVEQISFGNGLHQ